MMPRYIILYGYIWDNLADAYLYSGIDYDSDVECKRLNDDFTLYNHAILNYVGEIVAVCPNCQTENYHFNGQNFCCAFC